MRQLRQGLQDATCLTVEGKYYSNTSIADLLDNFHVGEVISIADTGVMFC
jgi:hypothetical protein